MPNTSVHRSFLLTKITFSQHNTHLAFHVLYLIFLPGSEDRLYHNSLGSTGPPLRDFLGVLYCSYMTIDQLFHEWVNRVHWLVFVFFLFSTVGFCLMNESLCPPSYKFTAQLSPTSVHFVWQCVWECLISSVYV